MPSASVTKTTGDTGRKVPVPRRWTTNAVLTAEASARCCSTAGIWSSRTSNGGISVMWVGMPVAVVVTEVAR